MQAVQRVALAAGEPVVGAGVAVRVDGLALWRGGGAVQVDAGELRQPNAKHLPQSELKKNREGGGVRAAHQRVTRHLNVFQDGA